MDREEWIIWIISNIGGYAILGDWKSNKYVSEGQGHSKQDREGLGKANLRLLEHPEERGRIYFVDGSR